MAIFIWAAIAIGILISIILIFKTTKSSKHEVLSFGGRCKKCGYKTNGLKCPRCERFAE
jgi:predicted Zn-ribbon and HTH transcriptional regulator